MSRVTKVPAVSPAASESPAELRRAINALAEAVDIRLGRRGDPVDRAITLRELIDSGLAKRLVNRPFDPNRPVTDFRPPETVDPIIPPAPTGVTASAAFRSITIFWDQPLYAGHARAEIWRFDANTIGSAVLIGTSSSTAYIDIVDGNSTYYYWVRFVSTTDLPGPFHATSGATATTAPDVNFLLTTLTGAVTSSQLTTSLQNTINLITAPDTTAGSVNARINDAVNTLQGQIDDLLSIPAYDNGTTYALDDQVVYDGRLYRALGATTGNLPTNPTYWELIGDYTSLGAAVAANTAAIAQLNFVDVSSTSASAAALAGLQATVTDGTTGLAATRALLLTDYYTAADTDSAIASATATFVSTTDLATELGDYVTSAFLSTNYTTTTGMNTAISTATANLVSNTALATELGDYVTNASLTAGYYTQSETDSAISAATLNLVSNTSLATTLGGYVTNAALTASYTTTTGMNTAIASAITTLSTSIAEDYATYAAMEIAYFTRAEGDVLEGQYTVKIDINGRVAGFGLANTSTVYNGAEISHSEFAVLADRFQIVGTGDTPYVPFIVTTTETIINGVTVPAGVYIDRTFISNGAIGTAQIGLLAVDTANIASLAVAEAKIADAAISEAKIQDLAVTNAKIASLNADKIDAGSIRAEVMEGTTVYADKLVGDVTTTVPFRNVTSVSFTNAETTMLEVEIPAATHPLGHRPFAIATGYIDGDDDESYRFRMYMQIEDVGDPVVLGQPDNADSSAVDETEIGGSLHTYYYIEYGSDITDSVAGGMTLSATGKTATATSVVYSAGVTRVSYELVSGGSFNTSDVITATPVATYEQVGETRHRPFGNYRTHFSLSGSLGVNASGPVNVKFTVQRYNNTDSAVATTSRTDYVLEVSGVAMGVR